MSGENDTDNDSTPMLINSAKFLRKFHKFPKHRTVKAPKLIQTKYTYESFPVPQTPS